MFDPYDWFTVVNKMRSIENMVYGINANGAKYGNSMIVDYMGKTLAQADKGREMTIGALVDVEELREYRRKTRLHNLLKQFRAECYTYHNRKVWPVNKPLLKINDYDEWASSSRPY
jgi:predicted amidohydrolase